MFIGDIIYSTSPDTHNGRILADGSAVSRTTYLALFGKIGVTFGNGDGSTTFNVPNVPDAATGVPAFILTQNVS